jgi:phage baseplate assembly protein W
MVEFLVELCGLRVLDMPIGGDSIISFGSNGAGSQQNDVIEIVKEKIKFLLNTNKGEIPGDSDYGCDLRHFLFGPIDDSMQAMIEATIKAEMSRYLPYVNVKNIVFDNSQGSGSLLLTLYFELAAGYESFVTVQVGGGG